MENYSIVNQQIDSIIQRIGEYSSEEDILSLETMKKNFNMKIEDFYREGRKLNIGVIGRVKAGKSSFLNTLLFDGEEVLPKAATPKTATLTKMEYSSENRILIEFYTEEEWEGIVEDAKLGDKNEITKSAKELVDMAVLRSLDVNQILLNGPLDERFDSYTELIDFLNDYVGENGEYTPLVKSVVIYMNREEFKDISIVDTPGLNDPIPSRTQKTKDFIEVCDVVFFLSRAGSFLDMNDWELLCKQLPQKGVKKMVLVASQYDLGLRDVLKKEDKTGFFKGNEPEWRRQSKSDSKANNIKDAERIVAESMSKRIKEKIASFKATHAKDSHDSIIEILDECKEPILISSRAHDMFLKSIDMYNQEERDDYAYWKNFISEENRKDEFKRIGNFDEIKKIYLNIKVDKQRLLEEKQREFIPKFYLELKDNLSRIKKEEELKVELLQNNDQIDLEEKQHKFESRINAITADIAEIFGDTIEKIKMQKLDVNKELRNLSIEAATLQTHTGTETHHGSSTTYRFRLGPIKLGRQVSHYSYTTTYTYLAASDALEQINIYGKAAANEIEEVFRQAVEMKAYRRKILETVIRNFDSSDEDFDANYFRIIVQKALNNIEFPEVKIDVSNELAEIGNKFSGEVRRSSEQDEFRNLLSVTIEKMYVSIVNKVDETISAFQNGMKVIEDNLANNILGQVTKEFENIKSLISNKEFEIKHRKEYLNLLNIIVREL